MPLRRAPGPVRTTLAALALLAAWIALPTPARAWNDCGSFGNADSAAVIRPGQYRCHDTTGTTASNVIATADCRYFDAVLDPDMAAATAGCEGYLWRCHAPAYSANTCTKMLVDTNGDGVPDDVTLDGVTVGRIGQQYQTATWVYWQPTANAGAKQCRLMITCH